MPVEMAHDLIMAARRLLEIAEAEPELFARALPLCDEDMQTLRELAGYAEEEGADADA
jgi:hypothetical protein